MALNNKEFIEVEFTGKIKDGEIFDSNIKEDLEKVNSNVKARPFVFCLGEGMFLKGVEDFLIGKEIGKHVVEVQPENAFGLRESKSVQMIPLKIFKEQKVNPITGAMFNFDGRVAKILTVSGGRVMVDFNNPLAGKVVVYNLNVLRKVEDINEKAKALIDFFTKKDFKFEIKDKKIIVYAEKSFVQFLGLFKDKFKGILDLDLEVKEKEKNESESAKKPQ